MFVPPLLSPNLYHTWKKANKVICSASVEMPWATWASVSFALTQCVMGVKGGMVSPVVEVYGAMLYDTVDI